MSALEDAPAEKAAWGEPSPMSMPRSSSDGPRFWEVSLSRLIKAVTTVVSVGGLA